MELAAHASYSGFRYTISYWRTASQIEVDFILGDHEIALELKGTATAQPHHLRGLIAFGDEYKTRRRILVTCDSKPQLLENKIEILPWKAFLEDLWGARLSAEFDTLLF